MVEIELVGRLNSVDMAVINDKGTYRHFRIIVENERNSAYNDIFELSVFGSEKCAILDRIVVGTMVRIKADLTGREKDYEGKTFVNMQLRAWSITLA